MNSTSAVDVSIHAVSPPLIFDESTMTGAVGAAGAASEAPDAGAAAAALASEAAAAAGALASAAGALAAGAASADAAAGADASSASAELTPAPINEPAMKRASKNLRMVDIPCFLESVRAGLAGANANDLFDRRDEDLAVTDLARTCCTFERFDRLLDDVVGHSGFDLHLGQKIDHVFRAAIELGMALLTAKALDLGHRDARDPDARQGLARLIELEGLDDCCNQFHKKLRQRVCETDECVLTSTAAGRFGPGRRRRVQASARSRRCLHAFRAVHSLKRDVFDELLTDMNDSPPCRGR
ncbi:protein of unknown function [Pararobbsia alpina]